MLIKSCGCDYGACFCHPVQKKPDSPEIINLKKEIKVLKQKVNNKKNYIIKSEYRELEQKLKITQKNLETIESLLFDLLTPKQKKLFRELDYNEIKKMKKYFKKD